MYMRPNFIRNVKQLICDIDGCGRVETGQLVENLSSVPVFSRMIGCSLKFL